MKGFKSRFNRGFTLIELMVVISIITLLSSIVLVSVKDVRERSKINAFRAEMNQLITALELYRVDKGMYPYEENNVSEWYSYLENDVLFFETTNGPLKLSQILLPYLSKIPNKPKGGISSNAEWIYYVTVNPINPSVNNNYLRRCIGDDTIPKYIILVSDGNSLSYRAVSDWATGAEGKSNNSNDPWSPILIAGTNFYRCFSLK